MADTPQTKVRWMRAQAQGVVFCRRRHAEVCREMHTPAQHALPTRRRIDLPIWAAFAAGLAPDHVPEGSRGHVEFQDRQPVPETGCHTDILWGNDVRLGSTWPQNARC